MGFNARDQSASAEGPVASIVGGVGGVPILLPGGNSTERPSSIIGGGFTSGQVLRS